MSPLDRAAVNLHYEAGLTLEDARSILKGTGIAPLEDEEDYDA